MRNKFFYIILLAAVVAKSQQQDFAVEEFNDEDLELLRQVEAEGAQEDIRHENFHAAEIAKSYPVEADPCAKVHCGAGRVCEIANGTAACVCIPNCPTQQDPRRMVCTNRNETWNSDCEVYRHRCLCDTNHADCLSEEHQHIHIDYYGQCKEMQECTEDDMIDFPRRMREWLYNVMHDMAERNELTNHYLSMKHEAETNMTRRWANAAIWKWCDLDGHPHDRSVSRHELFPIRAPLISLEHCIAPFLESCDPDKDHRVTLKEWGACLQLDETDMMEQCDEIAQSNNNAKVANEV